MKQNSILMNWNWNYLWKDGQDWHSSLVPKLLAAIGFCQEALSIIPCGPWMCIIPVPSTCPPPSPFMNVHFGHTARAYTHLVTWQWAAYIHAHLTRWRVLYEKSNQTHNLTYAYAWSYRWTQAICASGLGAHPHCHVRMLNEHGWCMTEEGKMERARSDS